MNHKLPRLTAALFITLAVVGGGVSSWAHQPEASARDESPGSRLVAEAARRVQEEVAVSADLRYRIDAFGHELIGLGNYRQLGRGPEKLLRMELKIQVANQAVTRQEICGRQFFWVRRESPLAAPSLGRVSLHQVRQAVLQKPEAQTHKPEAQARDTSHQPEASARDSLAANPAEVWILLGGLPKLLESLHQNFDFSAPVEDELQFTAADGQGVQRLPVLIVRGRWKPAALAAVAGEKAKPGPLPEQLPDAVELVLGRAEQVLPLFPYRVTYLKQAKASGAGEGREGELKPLISMELFNVYRKGDLDPREFEYNPGDQEVADLTPSYLERLGLAPKKR